ncbi:MAG: hypothetical protein ACR5KV_03235 [Wolbachia sp.]
MIALLDIVCDRKIKELQEYLNANRKILINEQLFTEATLNKLPVNGDFINKREVLIHLIFHCCIEFDSVKSEKGEILSF